MKIETVRATSATNTYTSPNFVDHKELIFIFVIYTSDGSAGNRVLRFTLHNEAEDILWESNVVPTQAASLVRKYEFVPGVFRESAFAGTSVQTPFPTGMVLRANSHYTIFDTANISAGDSFIVVTQYKDAD